jgi:hypothetical protein
MNQSEFEVGKVSQNLCDEEGGEAELRPSKNADAFFSSSRSDDRSEPKG